MTVSETEPVLELQDVHKYFDQSNSVVDDLKSLLLRRDTPPVRAVDGVDLTLHENQVQGLIGESGCGKSTLLWTLMGLHTPTGGEVMFKGKPVSEFDKADWSEFRQNVQVIFQDPFNSMNPKFTVREMLREPLRIHDKPYDEDRILGALERVHLRPAETYVDRRESQLSGGEKQRVSIARSLMLDPDVILADEPVSMLDVSTQAAVLKLLGELTEDLGVSMLYVSHDLSTVSYICNWVNVMYLGRVVESAPTDALLRQPKHPYTKELIKAIPVPDPNYDRERTQLQGTPTDPTNLPDGCRFKDRCPERMPVCDERPLYGPLDEDERHRVACHLYYDHEAVVAGDASGGAVGAGQKSTGPAANREAAGTMEAGGSNDVDADTTAEEDGQP